MYDVVAHGSVADFNAGYMFADLGRVGVSRVQHDRVSWAG